MITKNKIIFASFLLGILLMISFVSAFGISTPYSQTNPLILEPGESQEFVLTLSTSPSESSDLRLSAEVIIGQGVVSLKSGAEYQLPSEDKVSVRVNVPSAAAIGSEYAATVRLTEITPPLENGGMVTMGAVTDISFKVLVQEKEEPVEQPEGTGSGAAWVALVVVLAVVIIVIIYFLIKKTKRKR